MAWQLFTIRSALWSEVQLAADLLVVAAGQQGGDAPRQGSREAFACAPQANPRLVAVTGEVVDGAEQVMRLAVLGAAAFRSATPRTPCDVPIHGGFLPKASFSLYDFPDPADPGLAVVDTVTTDLVLAGRHEAGRYAET